MISKLLLEGKKVENFFYRKFIEPKLVIAIVSVKLVFSEIFSKNLKMLVLVANKKKMVPGGVQVLSFYLLMTYKIKLTF